MNRKYFPYRAQAIDLFLRLTAPSRVPGRTPGRVRTGMHYNALCCVNRWSSRKTGNRYFMLAAGDQDSGVLAVQKIPWCKDGGRLAPGGLKWPFPYLLRPWEIVLKYPGKSGSPSYDDFCMAGRKNQVLRWLDEWNDAEWEEFSTAYPDAAAEEYSLHAPRRVPVPWMIAADTDKAHRCPVCSTSAGITQQVEAGGGWVRKWRGYHCRETWQSAYPLAGREMSGCGQWFARRGLLLPAYEPGHTRVHRCREYLRWQLRMELRQFWYWHAWYPLRYRLLRRKRNARSL